MSQPKLRVIHGCEQPEESEYEKTMRSFNNTVENLKNLSKRHPDIVFEVLHEVAFLGFFASSLIAKSKEERP